MNLKSKITTIAAASIFALSLGTGALAETTTGQVTQEITAGAVTYSITGATLEAIRYNEMESVNNTGTLRLDVIGNGNLDGWDLSVQATEDFAYSGESENGTAIPADHLTLTAANQPTHVAGQPIAATHGPVASSRSGSLGSPISVISSPAGYGSGSYSQELDVSLQIPAGSQVGIYTGEVTVSTTSAPGK